MNELKDKLSIDFYERTDVVEIAQDLLGKMIYTHIDGQLTGGYIVETEAYSYIEKACHAYGNKRTQRTEIMFGPAGKAYVYLCYGIHHLFNIVTHKDGVAEAILIRAIHPTVGIDIMLQRRSMKNLAPRITAGPGSMSKALGITTDLYGDELTGNRIWLTEGILIEPTAIIKSPRVGVDYAGADALLPWRFRVKKDPYTSKAK